MPMVAPGTPFTPTSKVGYEAGKVHSWQVGPRSIAIKEFTPRRPD